MKKKIEDISAQLSVLWHETNPEKFQSTAPYDILARYLDQETQDKNDPKVINTIAAYETENGRYKSENLFKFQENIDELLGFYYQKPTNIKEIIKISQDWILPKEEHDQRDNLIKEIAKIPKHAIAAVAKLQSEISQNKAEIELLKTETQEQKEERLTQEGLQKAANSPRQKNITDFFNVLPKEGSSQGSSSNVSVEFTLNPQVQEVSRPSLTEANQDLTPRPPSRSAVSASQESAYSAAHQGNEGGENTISSAPQTPAVASPPRGIVSTMDGIGSETPAPSTTPAPQTSSINFMSYLGCFGR